MPLSVEVAVAAPLWQAYSYSVPADLAGLIRPLTRLLVPLKSGKSLGFALNRPADAAQEGLKPILDVLDEVDGPPALPAGLLGFFQRTAAYYQVPLGLALAWSLPAGMGAARPKGGKLPRPESLTVVAAREGLNKDLPKVGTQADRLLRHLQKNGPQSLPELGKQFKQAGGLAKRLEKAGWAAISHRPLVRDLLGNPLAPDPRPDELSPDQRQALDRILPALESRKFGSFLLHGVTGSGKTEVYLAACEKALAMGRQAIVLAPEIGICLRLEGVLKNRLGAENVAVLHSGLSPAARRGQWMALARGLAKVAVGARSAIFAPLADPGVICVDEEQDEAYKQEDRLRYNARDLAMLRAQEQGSAVIMGTATPAATTWHRAHQGEIELISMPRRVKQASLPKMEVLDLRSAGKLKGGFLSERLHQALKKTIQDGNQAILFLNRRGFAPSLICPSCGKAVGCPACSLSLTLHKAEKRLTCHTCGHQRPLPPKCPQCGADGELMKPLGLGTEAVAELIAENEPDWRLARLDRDTAGDPRRLGELLRQVADHEVDIVVGTQMISKGHHFPRISLVGVLLADQALNVPDFRAAERTYVLITQVAGRAGREGGPGLVIVQTYDPEHHAVRAALAHDPQSFYEEELEERQALGYPPFTRLMSLRTEAARDSAARGFAQHLAHHLEHARDRLGLPAQVLGPAPAPVAKVATRFRYLTLLKTRTPSAAGNILRLAQHQAGPPPAGVRLVIDVDPLTLN